MSLSIYLPFYTDSESVRQRRKLFSLSENTRISKISRVKSLGTCNTSLCFFICEMEIRMAPTLLGYCEE